MMIDQEKGELYASLDSYRIPLVSGLHLGTCSLMTSKTANFDCRPDSLDSVFSVDSNALAFPSRS